MSVYCGICESSKCQCMPFYEIKGGPEWLAGDYIYHVRKMLARAREVLKEQPEGDFEINIAVEVRRVLKDV